MFLGVLGMSVRPTSDWYRSLALNSWFQKVRLTHHHLYLCRGLVVTVKPEQRRIGDSPHQSGDCPTAAWCGASLTVLKHPHCGHSHASLTSDVGMKCTKVGASSAVDKISNVNRYSCSGIASLTVPKLCTPCHYSWDGDRHRNAHRVCANTAIQFT